MSSTNAISERFVTARKLAEPLPGYPGELPATLEDAYAIQDVSIERWPDKVAGWKVGMVPAPFRPKFAVDRIAGPIFETTVVRVAAGATQTMPIYEGGFAAVEAEFILQLGQSVSPSQAEYSDEELAKLVSAMYVGVEIASSPLATINESGPCAIISDFGNNAGLIVGPEISDWSSRALGDLKALVTVDNRIVGDATANAIVGGPLQALRFLLQTCAERELTLSKGALISTGAATGVHDVTVASRARVGFPPFGWFEIEFEAIPPKQ